MTWHQENNRLKRRFHFTNFVETLDFVNRVGRLAEQTQHHPDFHIYYKEVILELWTHDEGGVTAKDWHLAALIDALWQA